MQQALQSQEFIRRHCEDPRDFSRQRLLTFERVALFFLQGACSSLRFGMQQLLQSLLGNGGFQSGLTVSRQGVSKACRKFPYQAFVSLQQTGGRYLLRAKGHSALDGPASGWRGRNESPLAPYFGHGAGVWNPDQRPETRTPHGPDGSPLRRLGPHAAMRGIIALFDGRTLSGRATACRTESRRFVALRSWLSLLCVVCIASGTRCAGLHAPASPVPSGCRCVYREWSC